MHCHAWAGSKRSFRSSCLSFLIEVYNDIDSELINLFEVIRDDVDAFLKRADFLLHSRELYQRWQTDLENGSVPGDRVERAVRFWYVIRSAFGAHPGKGWAFQRARPGNSAMVIQNTLGNIRAIHDRLKTVEIDHLDFCRCIKNPVMHRPRFSSSLMQRLRLQ